MTENRPTTAEFNIETGKTIVREMTDSELEQWQADVAEMKAQADELDAKAAARSSALEKLAALGLSETEIAAL